MRLNDLNSNYEQTAINSIYPLHHTQLYHHSAVPVSSGQYQQMDEKLLTGTNSKQDKGYTVKFIGKHFEELVTAVLSPLIEDVYLWIILTIYSIGALLDTSLTLEFLIASATKNTFLWLTGKLCPICFQDDLVSIT